MKRIIPILIFFLFSSSIWGEEIRRLVLVELEDRAQIHSLYQMKVTMVDAGQRYVEVLATDEEIKAIKEEGFKVTILKEDYRSEAREKAPGYHDYEALVAEMNQIANDHPNIARLYICGYSVKGRQILGMKITDNPDIEENEPEIRLIGAHHGNELISVEIPLYMLNYLTDNYGSDPTVTDLVNNREIWAVPMMNPDGVESYSRYNANGVDLNRDYGYMWEGWGGSPGPFSQPETRAIRILSQANPFAISLSYHCAATYVNYLWDYTPILTQDNDLIVELSNGYADSSGYTPINGWSWYEVHGSCQDAEYGLEGTLGWTIETPFPSEPGIDEVCEENRGAILYMIKIAAQGVSGIVTDASTGEPLSALVDIVEVGWPIYSDSTLGDYHRVLLPGTYTLKVSANGYQTKTIPNIVVTSGSTTVVDVALNQGGGKYAFKVVTAEIADPYNSYNNHTLTPWALGPPDNQFLSIGVGGKIVLDMGKGSEIKDLPGPDFRVYEAGSTQESFYAYVSNTWNGPWTYLGMGTGTWDFDLSGSGLTQARYVKIVDDGNGNPNESYPGYDLDAIEGNPLPVVNITLIPDTTTVHRGGILGLTITVTNNTPNEQIVQVWADVNLPNGNPCPGNPVLGPRWVTLAPYQTRSRHVTQEVPQNAPLGTYEYCGKVGTYPNIVIDEDCFNFTVTP